MKISKEIIANIESSISESYKLTTVSPESTLCNSSIEIKVFQLISAIKNFLNREIFFPIRLLKKGFNTWIRDTLKFVILWTIFLILSSLFLEYFIDFSKSQGSNVDYFELIFILTFGIPTTFVILFISIFSAPSKLCFYGLDNSTIESVKKSLDKNSISSSGDISLIKEDLLILQKRVTDRVIVGRTITGLIGASFLFICSKYYDFILNNTIIKEGTPVLKGSDLINFSSVLAIIFLIWFAFFAAVESYSKVNNIIFSTAQFGCNDYLRLNNISPS